MCCVFGVEGVQKKALYRYTPAKDEQLAGGALICHVGNSLKYPFYGPF